MRIVTQQEDARTMSRSRKVDPETALGAAMAAFWKYGYGDLGTRQLEQETGITRFTLQTTYGGKMKLYLTALDAYLDDFERSGLLAAAQSDKEGIARFFEMRGDPDVMPQSSCNGCFMLNSTIEFSSGNEDVNQRADRYFAMLRNGFRRALRRSVSQGVPDREIGINAKVEVLLASALGLNVFIRAAGSTGAGREMAASIARMVRGWS